MIRTNDHFHGLRAITKYHSRLLALVLSLLPMGSLWAAEQDIKNRGEYLAHLGDCVACHSAPNGRKFTGGLPFATPFGVLYSTNITSDKETGIGHYSYEDFYDAMHLGKSPKGNLYPAMPYTSYHLLTDEDTKALYEYFMNTTPIKQKNKPNDVSFPFNIRFGLKAWNAISHEDGQFQSQSNKSDAWNRGKYIVDALGHCGECHTPRTNTFAMNPQQYFQGAVIEGYEASNITPEELNRQNWTHDDLATLFRTGYSRKGTVFAGMYPVVYHSFSYLTEEDMRSVSTYLLDNDADIAEKPLTFKGHDKQHPGYKLYMGYCAGCHGQDGEGKPNVSPAMMGNATLDRASPYNAIAVLLKGVPSQHYSIASGFYKMPGYEKTLTTEEIRTLTEYLRSTFTEQTKKVSVKDIQQVREGFDALPAH